MRIENRSRCINRYPKQTEAAGEGHEKIFRTVRKTNVFISLETKIYMRVWVHSDFNYHQTTTRIWVNRCLWEYLFWLKWQEKDLYDRYTRMYNVTGSLIKKKRGHEKKREWWRGKKGVNTVMWYRSTQGTR